jgi:hypothetical protein
MLIKRGHLDVAEDAAKTLVQSFLSSGARWRWSLSRGKRQKRASLKRSKIKGLLANSLMLEQGSAGKTSTRPQGSHS